MFHKISIEASPAEALQLMLMRLQMHEMYLDFLEAADAEITNDHILNFQKYVKDCHFATKTAFGNGGDNGDTCTD